MPDDDTTITEPETELETPTEEEVVTDPGLGESASTEERKLAGKYDSPEQLERGIVEARKALGLPELPKGKAVFGDGGLYRDITEAEAGYKEYETLIGKIKAKETPKPEAAKPKEPDDAPLKIDDSNEPESEPLVDSDPDVDAILQAAGLDGQTLADQWTSNGALTDAQYDALKKQGFPKAAVNGYLRGQQAEAALAKVQAVEVKTQITQLVGGDEQLNTVMQWAKTAIPDGPQKDALNARLNNPAQAVDAMKSLLFDYQKATGSGRSQGLINGDGPAKITATAISPSTPPNEVAKIMEAFAAGDEAATRRVLATPQNILTRLGF